MRWRWGVRVSASALIPSTTNGVCSTNRLRERRPTAVVKMQDVHIAVPLSYLNNYNSQPGNSARDRRRERAAKAAANQKLMIRQASLTVALVVQVETTGNDGVLTLHYGDGFDRTWEVGEPAKDSSLDMDVVGFVRRVLPSSEREANDEEVFRALLRCGAPRDDFTARLAEQERRRAVGPRQPLVKRLHGPSMEGPATIPVRSELKGATVEALAPAEPQSRRHLRAASYRPRRARARRDYGKGDRRSGQHHEPTRRSWCRKRE